MVEEQGAVPVEEVKVVHYHLTHKMLSEKKFLKSVVLQCRVQAFRKDGA